LDNEAKNEGAGAGGKAVKILFNNGIDLLIAPELGPKAMEAIKAFELETYRAIPNISVEEQIKSYEEGKLEKIKAHTVEEHSGLRRV